MKKIFGKIIGLSAIVMLLLSASKPSIEGRALVGNENELPPGMYIKAATFLPGDTVVITNPATKTSVEVMVFGIFNASNGFAAVLSPDVAKKLFINKDSDSIVQITKIGANAESMILNDVLNSIAKTSLEAPPVDFIDDSAPYVEEEQVEITKLIIEPVPEEPVVAIDDEPVPEEPVVAIFDIPVPPEDENIDDAVVFTPFANMEDFYPNPQPEKDKFFAEDLLTDPIIEPVPEEIGSNTVPFVEYLVINPIGDSIPEEEVAIADAPLVEDYMVKSVIEPMPGEEIAIVDAPPVEDLVINPISEPIPEKSIVIAVPLVEDTIVEPVIDSIPEEIVIVDTPFVEDLTLNPIIDAIPEEVIVVESMAEEIPNVLIPAQDYPPELAFEDEKDIERLPDFFIYENPVVVLIPLDDEMPIETAKSDFQVPEPVAFFSVPEESIELASLSTERNDTTNIEEYIHKYEVDSIQSFGKGNFCIQLGTYKNIENIEKVITDYADKYPVRLVKSEKIPDAYQVVVGPLNKDEYTIVLKLFESKGFDGAFLRPIN